MNHAFRRTLCLAVTFSSFVYSPTASAELVLSPGDRIDRDAGWTGNATVEENWEYAFVRDTDGDPTDGYRLPGTHMVFDNNYAGTGQERFAAANDTSPSVNLFGLGVNPPILPSAPFDEWWSIARWQSHQNGLRLQISGLLEISENTLAQGNAVFAIRQAGVWTELLNVQGTSGDIFSGADDFSTDHFELDDGDQFVIALRPTTSSSDFVFLIDENLSLTAVPEPNGALLAFIASSVLLLRRSRIARNK